MSRHADLNPPLGWMGGPCKVVERIEDKVRAPSLREDLAEKVEHGEKLTNPEAAKVYQLETERGAGLFKQIRITPHAQYRMDQRSVTVTDLRVFFSDFGKKLNDWKSQRAVEWDYYSRNFARREPVEWVDKRIGDLKVVFVMSGQGVADIVTTFWEGEPDPRPGACGTHPYHDHSKHARDVEDLSPVRTLVKDPSPSKSDTDKPEGESGKYPTRGLPSPPWSRTKSVGPPVYNGPGESGSNSDGTVHKDKVRTKGTPGGQYGGGKTHPDTPARISPSRRPGMTAGDILEGMDPVVADIVMRLAGMYPPAYPTSKTRHRRQRGQAYRYDRKRYRKQRGKIKMRNKRRYRRLKNNGLFRLDRKRRKKSPERFTTKPSGGVMSIKQRNERQRRKTAFRPVPFYIYATGQWGWVVDVTLDGVVHFDIEGTRYDEDLDAFFDEVVIEDDRLDDMVAYLDELFGHDTTLPDEEDDDDADEMFEAWVNSRTAYDRRRRQRGVARQKSRKQYLRNREAIKRRSRARYRRMRNNPAFKRQQKIRRLHPERFKMRTGLTLTTPDIAFTFITDEGLVAGMVHNVSAMSRRVSYRLLTPGHQLLQSMPVDEFLLKAVFLTEEDTESMFDLVDAEIGLEAYDIPDDMEPTTCDEVSRLAGEVIADFYRAQQPPAMSQDTKYDRANNHDEWARRDRERLEDIGEYVTVNDGNPGSKVLPSGKGHVEKEAALIRDIEGGCSPTLRAQGQKLAVKLRRVDAKNAMWLFDVQGSKDPYRVRLQAIRQGNVRALAKSHVRVSCSCPFWRWQGPEHWAKQGDYLYGSPIGSATKPSIKDPTGHHRACKHVLAVMGYVTSRNWDLPALKGKQAAWDLLARALGGGIVQGPSVTQSIQRVALRYLASQEVHDA